MRFYIGKCIRIYVANVDQYDVIGSPLNKNKQAISVHFNDDDDDDCLL